MMQPSKSEEQLRELWRTIRDNAKDFSRIVAKMDPEEVKQIKALWRTLRTGRSPRKRKGR
jgi:hypothetical protein